jgi:hypothetical protein
LQRIDSRPIPVRSGLQPSLDYCEVGGWDLTFGRHLARLNPLPKQAVQRRLVLGLAADGDVGDREVELTSRLRTGVTAKAIPRQHELDSCLIDLRSGIGLCERSSHQQRGKQHR